MNDNKRSARKGRVLDRLNPEEAQAVLPRPQIARSLLAEVTFETVADEVEEAVRAPDLEDLNGRAGRHEWGYVEPTEAAWEILEEAVNPFLDDMKRQIQLGLEVEALEICKSMVLGLYRVEKSKGGELVEWAPDFPAEAAAWAVQTWATGGGGRKRSGRSSGRKDRRAFSHDLVDHHVPDWRSMIARVLSRTR